MKIVVLGTEEDVRGFSLAGVGGRVCRTDAEVTSALRDLTGVEAHVGLLLLSPSVASLAPPAVRSVRELGDVPAVVVLPDHEPAELERSSDGPNGERASS